MRQARNWLPATALDGDVVATSLAGATRDWSAAWFSRGRLAPAMSSSAEAMRPMERGQWFDSGCGLAVAVPDAARSALVSMMLGVAVPGEAPVAVDTRILLAMVRDCLDDLGRRLAALFALPAETRWALRDGSRSPDVAAPHGLVLRGDASGAVLRLVVANDLAVAMRKAGLPLPRAGPPLAPRADALSLQKIAVSAAIGNCRLTVAELADLGVGDLLVFDAAIAGPLGLAIDGVAVSPATWRVAQADDWLRLELLKPIQV